MFNVKTADGNGKTFDYPADSGKFAMAVMQKIDTAKGGFNVEIKLLKEQPQTDTNKISAIGY